jgi:AhpD family alkylhydroperoxidase
MKTFNVPTRDQVSPSSQASFDSLQKAIGMVPNLYASIAYSENGLSRYLAFQGGKTSLNNREKEAVNLVVSEVNGCRYCQSAHTAIGKMNGFTEADTLDLRAGVSKNPKLNALVGLAKEITEKKGRISDPTLEAFYEAGYNKGNLVDVILLISDKIAMNYLHNLTNVDIDFPLAAELNAAATVEN